MPAQHHHHRLSQPLRCFHHDVDDRKQHERSEREHSRDPEQHHHRHGGDEGNQHGDRFRRGGQFDADGDGVLRARALHITNFDRFDGLDRLW